LNPSPIVRISTEKARSGTVRASRFTGPGPQQSIILRTGLEICGFGFNEPGGFVNGGKLFLAELGIVGKPEFRQEYSYFESEMLTSRAVAFTVNKRCEASHCIVPPRTDFGVPAASLRRSTERASNFL
jgi:hypothetical protein